MQLFPGQENTPQSIDVDRVAREFRFPYPTYLVWFVGTIAATRLYGYAWNCWRAALDPIFNGLWALWMFFLVMVGLFAWVNYLARRDPIQPWQATTLLILFCLATAAIVGDHLQKGVC